MRGTGRDGMPRPGSSVFPGLPIPAIQPRSTSAFALVVGCTAAALALRLAIGYVDSTIPPFATFFASIVGNAPLPQILERLTRTVEEYSGKTMLASILLMDVDGKHLRHGAAPGLPDDYNRAIDGVEIGPSVGSCGTAAFRGEPV